MSKKKKENYSGPEQKSRPPFSLISFLETKSNQVIIVLLMAILLYGNTLYNQYALDDGMVLKDNKFVQKGISGIPDILTHDSFYGAIGENKNLSGGRYRPLSLVLFAIELSLLGKNPFVFHLFNVLLYALTGIVLLLFLRKFIFRQQPLAAFVSAILFIIHPVHTEVVANIKSCDEILSLLFLILTLYFLLTFISVSKKRSDFVLSLLFYGLALLSKENGLTFVILVPVTIYFFSEKKIPQIFRYSMPFLTVAILYIAIRILLIGWNISPVTEVMDNPYLLASVPQKYGTIFFVLLRYLQLLLWPHPLSYDYSYNQISYRDFSDRWVLLSILLHLAILFYAIMNLKKRDLFSWCIIFYLGSVFIVSNSILNIGAPMAERFLFQASMAFSIFIVEFFQRILLSLHLSQWSRIGIVLALLAPVFIASAYTTQLRNRIWRSDETLFLNDVKTSSNSARANTYAGVALIRLGDQSKTEEEKRSYALKALEYFRRSSAIKPDYITTLLNMGVAYSRLDSTDRAEAVWEQARVINPHDKNFKLYDQYLAEVYNQRALKEGINKNYLVAIEDFEKSLRYNPNNADAWYNLGGAYYTTKQYELAKTAWSKTLQLNPNQKQAAEGLNALEHMDINK